VSSNILRVAIRTQQDERISEGLEPRRHAALEGLSNLSVVIVHQSNSIDRSLLDHGIVENLPHVVGVTSLSGPLEVVVQRCVKNTKLCSELCQIRVKIVDGILPIFPNRKQLGISRLFASIGDEFRNERLVNMLDGIKSEALSTNLPRCFSQSPPFCVTNAPP
jgi:hypothetical protein